MDKKLLLIGGLGAVVVLALGILVGNAIGGFWYAPQQAPLPTLNPAEVATRIPPTASQPDNTPTNPETAMAVTPTPTEAPTPTPKPLCGGPPTMDILLIGSYRGYYDLADAIRIAHVDFTKPEVVVVTIPRDLIVKLPDDSPYPSPVKLNQSYFLGTPIMQTGAQPTSGAELLARTIGLNFGVQVDHYAIISGNSIREFITALGGVTVCISEDINDDATKLKIKAGCHNVDGWDFMRLLRYRGDQGDLFRLKNQNWFLQGVLDRIFSPQILKSWDDLLRLYGDLVMTDLSPAQISQLLCLGRHLDKEKIHFVSPPEDFFQLDEQQIYLSYQPIYSSVLLWDNRFVQWLQEQLHPTP